MFGKFNDTHIRDTYFSFGRCLHEGALRAKLPRHHHALVLAHHPLVLQVALVPHQHHRHVVRVLHAEDLLPEVLHMENKDFKKIFTRQQKYLRGDHEVDSVLTTFATNLEIVEGGLGSDAVDQDEALTILHVQISHGCELFLEQNILI